MLTDCHVNNYKILEQLGSGGYGLVFHVKDTLSNKDFAMKIIVKSFLQQQFLSNRHLNRHHPHHHNHSHHHHNNSIDINNQDGIDHDMAAIQYRMLKDEILHFFRLNQYKLSLPSVDLNSIKDLNNEELAVIPRYKEISLHLKVHSHKNIVTIHDVMECSFGTFVIMDYYPTDLFNSIVSERHFINDGHLIKKVFLQICSAIEYCHSKGIYHCDIKPENLLLDSNDNIYLCDFGLSTTSEWLTPNVSIGSSFYMAPERILCFKSTDDNNMNDDNEIHQFHTKDADVWSLGILLINLVCIRNPWLKAHQIEDNTFRYFVKDHTILKKILPISNALYDILLTILQLKPNMRCNITDLMIMIRDVTSLQKQDPSEQNNGTINPLTNVRALSETEFNKLVAVNEVNDSILDMDYLYDTLTSNNMSTMSSISNNNINNNNNNNNMNSVVSTVNNSPKNDDDDSTLYTADNLNKENGLPSDDSRYDISTVNTLFASSNSLTQFFGNTPR